MKKDCALEAEPSTRISRVRRIVDLLGDDVVLIPVISGTKKPAVKNWQQLDISCMSDAKHLRDLARGNIGVLLGGASGNLVTVDLDDDAAVEPFLNDNPRLRDTFTTRRRRGCNFWLRLTGDCPPTFKLKSPAGEPLGEFRSTGSQTVIHGTADGVDYRILNQAAPLTIAFEDLKFSNTAQKPHKPLSVSSVPSVTSVSSVTSVTSVTLPTEAEITDWIAETAPTATRQNHDLVFQFARRVKGWQQRHGEMSNDGQKIIFNRWLDAARPFLRHTDFEYWLEYLDALDSVKYPHGEEMLNQAWERAQKADPPAAARNIDDPDIKKLSALCVELQLVAGDKPFILPARTVQKLFNHTSPMRSWRWLRGLCRLKILEAAGSRPSTRTGRATNLYRYIAT